MAEEGVQYLPVSVRAFGSKPLLPTQAPMKMGYIGRRSVELEAIEHAHHDLGKLTQRGLILCSSLQDTRSHEPLQVCSKAGTNA